MILLHEVTKTATRWDRIWRVRGRNSDLPLGLLSSHIVVVADIFSTLQSFFFLGGCLTPEQISQGTSDIAMVYTSLAQRRGIEHPVCFSKVTAHPVCQPF